MLSHVRGRFPTPALPRSLRFGTAAEAKIADETPKPAKESRWQRLKRLRKSSPTPENRTKHQFDRTKAYELSDALRHVRSAQWAKFDESLELILRLNIDPRLADQNLRGVITLPHGTGRADRVVVFAEDDDAEAARAAGADLVGGDDLINDIKANKGKSVRGFAAAVAVPHMLPLAAARIGRILGPKGIMPSEKTGTVVSDVAEAVRRIKRGWLSYRTDKHGNMHMNVGKLSFDDKRLLDNVLAAVRGIMHVRPASVKKKFVKRAVICSSMGPSVELDLQELAKQAMAQSADQSTDRSP